MKVALGVGGGIAAYKAAEVARTLMERGFEVEVVMTRAAQEFIRPLTFPALTGHKVLTDLFASSSAEETLSSSIEHIRVAQDNQILVIVAATADLTAKLAHGLADDLLTTTYLAFTGPVIVAPAMNSNMWNHAATQSNLETLRNRGHVIVEPGDGLLACGMMGPGRLAEPEIIVRTVVGAAESAGKQVRRDLEGETILITAGPTQEAIDGVRYISNRSSGKMGYAIAEAARQRGAHVVLVSGPVSLKGPEGVELVHVRSAIEMRQAVLDHLPEASVVIKAAAVADYYIPNAPPEKRKKTAARLSLDLEPTPDILAEIGSQKGDRVLIGFAAETDHLAEEAHRKLIQKKCDMVVGNLVSAEGTGFDSDDNEVLLVTRDGQTSVSRASKRVIAGRILDQILPLRAAQHAATRS